MEKGEMNAHMRSEFVFDGWVEVVCVCVCVLIFISLFEPN